MAFHIACPLTCRKICYCSFGRPRPPSQSALLLEQIPAKGIWPSLDHLFEGGNKTVDVIVPCLTKDVKKSNKQKIPSGGAKGGEQRNASRDTPSARKAFRGKKTPLGQRRVVEVTPTSEPAKKTSRLTIVSRASEANNDGSRNGRNGASVRSEELGGAQNPDRHHPRQEGGGGSAQELRQPLQQTVCGICTSVEIVGGEREKRMLSCRSCNKKYHRKCVKRWADHRDLFDWTSWVCGSCRSCEVCRQTGDPNKLMFCKRCDEGLHIYCQQPPLKHVPKGPYLCSKHTLCHSCNSNVPGSGVSSRWFMSYTTCDACGRLFVKDKYCPVCLKVYRDSEVTPMVCCDSCEHWVHCWCDGISDEQFYRYQNDDGLRYVCAACRGECHKVESAEDAVQELWRRRDATDVHLRARIAAAAGMPSAEEMQEFIPSSDDEKPSAPRVSVHPTRLGGSRGRLGTDNGGMVSGGRDGKQEGSARKKLVIRSNPKTMPTNSRALGGTSVRTKSIFSTG